MKVYKKEKSVINALTSLRFFMMCMIVINHMGYWGGSGSVYDMHFHNASMAVNYFFMLSGFGLTYTEKLKKNNVTIQIRNLYQYAFAKVKKIYAIYMVTMLVCIPFHIYTYLSKDGRSLIYTCSVIFVKLISVASLLQSVTGRSSFTHALNGVGWFLSTLFVIYMFYPILKKWNQQYMDSIKKCNCAVIALLLLYGIIAKLFYVIEEYSFLDELEYCSPLIRVIPFTLGIVICDRLFLEDKKRSDTTCEILILGIMLSWFFLRNAIAPGIESHEILIFKQIVDIIIVMCILMVFSREKGFVSELLNNKIFVSLGNITMYIYLIHHPVVLYVGLIFNALGHKCIYKNIFRTILIIGITGLLIWIIEIKKKRGNNTLTKQTLILFFNEKNKKNEMLNCINARSAVDAECVFRNTTHLGRAVRKLHFLSKLYGISIWFDDWKKQLGKYNMVICIATKYSAQTLEYIKKNNSNAKLINYHWDPIEMIDYKFVKDTCFENWSFCKRNCDDYLMKYNPQFYMKNLHLPVREICYDIVFIGADREGRWKNRTILVEEYNAVFKSQHINAFIWFHSSSKKVSEEIRRENELSSDEYYEKIAESKAVLEIVEPDFEWITLRPLLALSNGKKLITNNAGIIKEKYYIPDNIFVLGVDNIEQLKRFIGTPFRKYDKGVLEYYEFEAWLNRFWENENDRR